MGVAVLHPQDCLKDGVFHHRRLISPPRSKPRRTPNPNPSPVQTKSNRRKHRSPSGSPPPPPPQPKPLTQALSGQIRILKRGEDLPPIKVPAVVTTATRQDDLPPTKVPTAVTTTTASPVKIQIQSHKTKTKREGSVERANSDPVALSTYRKSPEPVPAPIPNLFVAGFYAGSAFSTSPPPSSLPLPGFCTKAVASGGVISNSTAEDVVALDLRRILRIEQ